MSGDTFRVRVRGAMEKERGGPIINLFAAAAFAFIPPSFKIPG